MKYIHLTRHQNQHFKKQPTHHLRLKIYTQAYIHQWCADLEIPSPRNSASASIGSADGPRPQVKLRNGSADRPRPQITTTNELK